MGSFIRGHSDNEVCASLIEYFGQCVEDLENVCWLDRVPSGSNPAEKPSAVLVHKRLGGPEQISAQTHLKGRLIHVRIHQGENSIDIINLYQHVWRSQLDREGNTKCREAVWKKLRQVTAKIPQRNTLVVGGDFNCTIRRMKHHIGSAVVEAREPSPDQEELLGYLQDHGMTLLNTWHAKPAYTCQTGDSQTQIDFLLCREQHADRTAKDSKPWHQAPIGKWKANHHVPVWASIRHFDPGKLPRKQIHKSFKNTLQGSIMHNDRQAQQLQFLVEQKVSELTSTGCIEDISDQLGQIMTSTISEVYSPDARADQRLSQDPQVQLSVKAMWRTCARYREAKTATFQNIFAKWKQFAIFHKTSRAYKAKTKEVKLPRNWPRRIKKGTNGNSGNVPNVSPHGNQRIVQAGESWPRSSNYLSLLNIARRSFVVVRRVFPSALLMQTFGLIQFNSNSTSGRYRCAKRSPSISLLLQRGDCVQRV